MRKKIGECLIQDGLITENDLRGALAEHKRTSERLGYVLVRLNLATEQQIAKALAFQLGFPFVNLSETPPDPGAVTLIPKDVALECICVAVRLDKNLLTVAMSDPLLFSLVEDLEWRTGYRITQVIATRGDIVDAIQTCYPDETFVIRTPKRGSALGVTAQAGHRAASPGAGVSTGETAHARSPEDAAFELPPVSITAASQTTQIIDLVDLMMRKAIESKASDIHVEPMENGVLIRHRLDGLLKDMMDLPKSVHEGLIARLKFMAGMDVAEKRLPQSGRLRATSEEGTRVDLRVSTLRTLYGEKVILRMLDHRKLVPPLEELGLSAASLEELSQVLRHQHGMLLVVGPRGSGKSTTLSSALQLVQSEKANIITIEDPVEYLIPGVNQTQIDEDIALTFSSALRSILRQDPDVILVGEIRDAETAKIAMQAAQAGHLVLSALHTDDAPSVVTRLMDMGTEPYVIAGALAGVVAQRLVRRLCVHCRRSFAPQGETLKSLNISDAEAASIPFYNAVGCDQCNHTGYRGRIGIYEVMTVTDKLRRLIASRAPEHQIREAAVSGGMVTLAEDGLSKVKDGITTPEELLRVVSEVRETRTLCEGCGAPVRVDFLACPRCGKRQVAGCPHCGRALQRGWSFCPYCAKSTGESTKVPKRPREREVLEPGPELRRPT